MEDITPVVHGLESAQIEQFITDGFVRIDQAFPREHANAARAILWKATGCDPDDPATWTQPVIRLGMFTQAPFIEAANTPRLHAAFDQLVGRGAGVDLRRWGPSRCGSRLPPIPATPVGTSMSASARTRRTSCPGAPISTRRAVLC